MRVFLVSVNRESAPFPVAPLGIAYVAGAARKAGHEVELLDLCFSRDVEGDIDRAVRRFAPELVGISIRNVDNLTFPASVSYLDEIQAAVAALRRVSSAPIVAGGPGFSIFPERLLSLLDLDFGIIGEGEETFCLLAKHLSNGSRVRDLPNLIRRGNVAPNVTPKIAPSAGNGLPARDLLDNARYLELGGMANLQTKRGCPFECTYCTYPYINGPSLRLRPPTEVVDELASMVEGAELNQVFLVD
ncbi:MAG TPA: cobalamin-dependent protein, partial [archaeon]|nr:cobalamin-dependent protein [archaeon]